VNKKRPVNLDIGTIKLPITSYVSILHRVSGVFLFPSVAILLWLFDLSLASQQSFETLQNYLASPLLKFVIFCCLAALVYHMAMGIRHLIMDFGIAEENFESGRRTAWIAIAIAVIIMIIITIWIFLW
jgi:succinate dehydrogenase / fumarate reductase cytochrome b subunit